MHPLLSIIVPIYNVEEYLVECIESVLTQSYKNYELILVNDESPDNSKKICEAYAVRDDRIKVINKKNGGLSDARNAGLSCAKGQYICFLDGDDSMAHESLKSIADFLKNNNLDLLTCAHNVIDLHKEKKFISLPYESVNGGIDRNQFLTMLSDSSASYWSAWKNIYKRDIITQNNLKFTLNLIGAEDCDFFMRFVKKSELFNFLNRPSVNYKIDRTGSIMNVMSKDNIIGQLSVFYENYLYYKNKNTVQSKKMKSFFANKFGNTVSLLYRLQHMHDRKQVILYLKEKKDVFKDMAGIKYKIAKIVWTFMGFYHGSKLLSIFSKKI